jgi:hypothetical protein
MGKSWGIYVRFGRICMTKKVGSLLQAMKRYNRLKKRRIKPDLWFALVPIEHDDCN